MPIEIKIIDAHAITQQELDWLYASLSKVVKQSKEEIEPVPHVEPVIPVTPRKKRKAKEPAEALKVKEMLNIFKTPSVNSEGNPVGYIIHKPEEIIEPPLFMRIEGYKERVVPECPTFVKLEIVPSIETASPIVTTPEALVSYVLEATRTKKLTFDQVFEVLTSYNVPGLNDLNKHLDIIDQIYNALKEIANE